MENRIRSEIIGYRYIFFQVGQKWKTRRGDIVTITKLDFKAKTWEVLYDEVYWVTIEGKYTLGAFSNEDLVELIEDVAQDLNKELEQETKTEATSIVNINQVVKLSDFLKENNAYDSFIEQSLGHQEEYIPNRLKVSDGFSWQKSKEGENYWKKLFDIFENLPNKDYDMLDLVIKAKQETKVEETIPNIKQDIQPEPQTEYFVFVQGFKAPKVAHKSLASAEKEAIRLSYKEIGREVSIMTKVKSYKSEVIVKEILC